MIALSFATIRFFAVGFTHYCGQRHKSGTFTVWRIRNVKVSGFPSPAVSAGSGDAFDRIGTGIGAMLAGSGCRHASFTASTS
ncbi:MAG TPA: hypothetical protein VJP02_21205 [Candidatus Sulfotelmatobacter sp.]|nr:hypothetical protein [Candidatus Sulfotelmatobacter sp.]